MCDLAEIERFPIKDDKKKYIVNVLDPVIQDLVGDALDEMPAEALDYFIKWLRNRTGVTEPTAYSIVASNKKLKMELKQTTSALEEVGTVMNTPVVEEEEEEEDDDDDECEDIPERKPEANHGRARQSVSAEAYGAWNTKTEFTPPVHPKSDDQKKRLKATLIKSFMFAEIDQKDMETIISAMKEVNLEPGTKVISEGEDGDYLFVIESGSLECMKNIDGVEKIVKTCSPGDVFGELAILYNCPRAASVVAKEACVCWQLDRETVNHVVKDASMKRRNKYETFLKSVALISSLDVYERSQVADALKLEVFRKGDVVVTEGEAGDKFYIVEEGSLFAMKVNTAGAKIRVKDYSSGDYFGELALLKNQPRAASIVVASDTAKVLSMTRSSFSRVLGPLQSLLAKNATYSSEGVQEKQ